MHIIKKTDLIALDACASGMKFFETLSKLQGDHTQIITPEGITPLHTVFLYQMDARMTYWLEENNVIPTNDLNDITDPQARAMVERARNALKKTK